MNRATVFCGLFAQRLEVTPIILVGIETGAAVVAALDDMPRNVGDGDPRSAGHDGPPVSVVLRWLILTETVVRPLFRTLIHPAPSSTIHGSVLLNKG